VELHVQILGEIRHRLKIAKKGRAWMRPDLERGSGVAVDQGLLHGAHVCDDGRVRRPQIGKGKPESGIGQGLNVAARIQA
jgi:hypothetical protein